MIKRFVLWFRSEILLWQIARMIDAYYGDRVCWVRLVGWALFDTSLDQLGYCFTDCTKEDPLYQRYGTCYCGGKQGIPYISFKFMLTGRN